MPQDASEDCNGNGVRDTCDRKEPGGTCVLSGYVADADDVSSAYINGDIRFAYVKEEGNDLLLGMGFYNTLTLDGSSKLYELWWYFDTDNNPNTGSPQVGQFGGDINIRANILGNGTPEVRVNDNVVIGTVAIKDNDRLVVVRVPAPSSLVGLSDGRWIGVSGGINGPFQPDTDKTPIASYATREPLADDCDNNGWFDACENVTDESGLGPGRGDGVPDACQQDDDSNGIDDTCQEDL